MPIMISQQQIYQMNASSEEIVKCGECQNQILSRVWPIHEIMCQRAKKMKKQAEKEKKEGFLSSIKGFFQGEQLEEADHEALIPCLQCGESFPFQVYAVHEQECIGHQLTMCRGCGLKYPTFLFDEHEKVCEGGKEQVFMEEQIEEEEEGANEILQSLIQTLANREEAGQEGLNRAQLANLTGFTPTKVEDCPICCTDMRLRDRIIRLNCKHSFHGKCINSWLSKNPLCPMCRQHALKR